MHLILTACLTLILLFLQGSDRAQAQTHDLLPDMITMPELIRFNRLDTTTIAGRTLLRLSNGTPNIGEGRLELRASTVVSSTQREVDQRIFRSDGTFTDRFAGTFTFHSTHDHFHFDDWVVYRIREITPDEGVGPVVAEGEKASFCIFDLFVYDVDNPFIVFPPLYTTCGASVQGMTPGWGDVYDLNLPDQWVDITDVPEGFYWLEAEVDPLDRILEIDETNNASRILLWVGPPPPALPDRYEENDSIAEVSSREEGGEDSPNLGLVNGRRVIEGLSMEDGGDYFLIRLNTAGAPGDHVRIETDYYNNDLDLVLLSPAGTFLALSIGPTPIEQISLAGFPAGEYVILVDTFFGQNPDYRLIIEPGPNGPPAITLLSPPAEGIWVERAYETLPVAWEASDPDGDPTRVALSIDRDGVLGKDTLPLGGFQNLPGSSGLANVNSAGMDLGLWYLTARVSDGAAVTVAWAPGPFIVYVRGDLDLDGDQDLADFRALLRLFRTRPFPAGCAMVADMDRDGDVDGRDVALLRAAAREGDGAVNDKELAMLQRAAEEGWSPCPPAPGPLFSKKREQRDPWCEKPAPELPACAQVAFGP